MKPKKIILIVTLVVIVIAAIVFVVLSTRAEETLQKSGDGTTTKTNTKTSRDMSNIVIGDEYFITQINDIYYNPNDYLGRNVEIEGFPMLRENYTFVGRYRTRVLCWRWIRIS